MKVTTENVHKEFVAVYKKNHKELNLQIKQEFLTQIMNGTKKQEIREIKPTTERKYLVFGEDGYPEEDKDRFIEVMEPVEVAVKKTESGLGVVYEDSQILPVYKAKKENGEDFEAVMVDGEELELVRAHGENGKELVDEDGLPIMAIAYYEELDIKTYRMIKEHIDLEWVSPAYYMLSLYGKYYMDTDTYTKMARYFYYEILPLKFFLVSERSDSLSNWILTLI